MPDLTVVVPDNDGGGIFAQLEPGEDRLRRATTGGCSARRTAATWSPWREALGWAATRVTAPGRARRAHCALGGPRVVVVRTDQRAEATLARELRRPPRRRCAADRAAPPSTGRTRTEGGDP